MSGSGSDETEAIARASAAAEELYRLRDTYFPRDPEEKTSRLRTLADAALALLDSLPLGRLVLMGYLMPWPRCQHDLVQSECARPPTLLRADQRTIAADPVAGSSGTPSEMWRTIVLYSQNDCPFLPADHVLHKRLSRAEDPPTRPFRCSLLELMSWPMSQHDTACMRRIDSAGFGAQGSWRR
ncbi:hypothetical protein BHE74_00037766 [Ensete ventricosum]|nr:hypothetical protein BHE74_00037766 [Ensete ventricosum]